MVAHAKVTAAFRRLVALIARAFYAGEFPAKTPEELAAPVTSRKKQQVESQPFVVLNPDSVSRVQGQTCWVIRTGYYTWLGHHFTRRPLR